nr:ABC transporter permease subunit [Actinomyces sp.]
MSTASTTPPLLTPAAHPAGSLRTLGPAALAVWLTYLAVVLLVPDAPTRTAAHAPLAAVSVAGLACLVVWWLAALARPTSSAASALRHRLPRLVAGGAWFIVWQVTTAKLALLEPPYFASPEVLIGSFLDDWRLLASCLTSSALLLLTGYAAGSALGFLTGLLMGWSPRADYWLHPLLQTLGPVPASALLPLALLLMPTTYLSAALIVAFGAWFPMATMTRAGVRALPRDLIDVARTLGADEHFLVRRLAVPSALPDMLTGLFTGLGTSLAALMTAELVGVDRGLAWYISWVKGWADYPRMYVGLIVLIVLCRSLMVLLFRLRSSLLAWQHDLVRW